MKTTILTALLVIGLAVEVCLAQIDEVGEKFVQTRTCSADINYEEEGYRVVGNPKINTPYAFLPWVKKKIQKAESEIAKLYTPDNTFTYDKLKQGSEMIEETNFFPDTSDDRVKLTVEFIAVENCSGKNLNLVYGIYSTQLLGALSSTAESRKVESRSPQTTSGFDNVAVSERPLKFTPTLGYDLTNKVSGGGRVVITPQQWSGLTFNSMTFEGQASSKMKMFSAGLSGSSDSDGWIRRSDWRLNYDYSSLPTEIGNIKKSELSAQFAATTRSLGNDSFTVRFGGLIEGGNQQSSIRGAPLTSDTISNTVFGSLKLYAGLDSRLRHNIFSMSYGVQLGTAGRTPRIDWVKHIGDFKHQFWYPLGDHRILDLESRFTLGTIRVPGKIPLSERFFGGSNEQLFIPNNEWQIRANPVIRAIPGSRLYETANGIGASNFYSYNFSASYTIWREPLIPSELTNDLTFKNFLQIAIDSSLNTGEYVVKDPHFNPTFEYLEKIKLMLPKFSQVLVKLKENFPNQFDKQFRKCDQTVRGQIRELDRALATDADPIRFRYGPTTSWAEGQRTKSIIKDCVEGIKAVLPDESVFTSQMIELNTVVENMNEEYKLINLDEAIRKAKKESFYRFTSNTLNTLIYDVNVYSISPVFIFDVARIGPKRSGFGGVRYGPGLGLKLELVNSVNITAGYAWNVRQRSGEGRGNVFFSFGFRDLFSF